MCEPSICNDQAERLTFLIAFIFRTKITKTHISTVIKAYIPESFVEGFYRGEGRFNNIKIKSKGYFNASASKSNDRKREIRWNAFE